MKKLSGILILSLILFGSAAQEKIFNVCVGNVPDMIAFDFNAENDSSERYFKIDTSQQNNLWQFGKVYKSMIDTTVSGPRALITDTSNTYPINNLSSVEFKVLNRAPFKGTDAYHGFYLNIWSKIDSELNTDGGTIEVKHTNGDWVNVIEDPLASVEWSENFYGLEDTVSSLGKPGLTGSPVGWSLVNLMYWTYLVQTSIDTVSFRLTFASDSVDTQQDGWLIHRIEVIGYFESMDELHQKQQLHVFPNPANDILHISINNKSQETGNLEIFDALGRSCFKDTKFKRSSLDISALEKGLYILRYSSNNGSSSKQFIKE